MKANESKNKYQSARLRDGKIWMLEDLREKVKGAVWNEGYNCYMYSWEQAQKAVPEGWRLPSAKDFISLAMAYGYPDQFEYVEFAKDFHGRLAGFAPGSSLYYQGSFAYWWSSTVNSAAGAYLLGLDSSNIYPQSTAYKCYGFSVRCIKT